MSVLCHYFLSSGRKLAAKSQATAFPGERQQLSPGQEQIALAYIKVFEARILHQFCKQNGAREHDGRAFLPAVSYVLPSAFCWQRPYLRHLIN